jgi:UDP-glucose 4-epimerase
MKVLIIGSGGYTGRRLQAFLRAEGLHVRGVSSADGTGIDPRTGLLPDDFVIAGGTDAVVYLAQSPHYHVMPEMFWHLLNVNVTSAVKVAESARKAKVGRFLYASTGSVYEASFAPLSESSPLRRDDGYALSKVHAEEALSVYRDAMDVVVMRIFGMYGPIQTGKLVPKLFDSVLKGKEISIERNPTDESDLDGLRISLCYIEDTVEIVSGLIKKGGLACINVAGNEAVSIRKLATLMGHLLRKTPKFKIADRYRRFDLIADNSLLKRVLNPAFTSLEAGLKQTFEDGIK